MNARKFPPFSPPQWKLIINYSCQCYSGSRCPCGEYCTNKRFQRHSNADVEIFLTENKGHGLRAVKAIPRCVIVTGLHTAHAQPLRHMVVTAS